jgi:hypothetical protein
MKALPRHGREENLNLQEDKAAKACNSLRAAFTYWALLSRLPAARRARDGCFLPGSRELAGPTLVLLRHKQLYLLILRSLRQQASRRTRPGIGAGGLMVRDGADALPHHEGLPTQ